VSPEIHHQHVKIEGEILDVFKPNGRTSPGSMNKNNPLRRTWMKIGFVIEHERRLVLQNSGFNPPEGKKTKLEIFQN
jgi:hypothetical protein